MLVLTLLHAAAAILLAIYGANSLLLTVFYLRRRPENQTEPSPPANWPAVTVQLPVFNELHVTERLLAAVTRLEYPRDRLQIQVLDDSTDETTAIAAACVERYRQQGVDIQHLHRTLRPGFKAGALAAALPEATGDFIAIFDADFVPQPDFLLRTVPALAANVKAGYLQTRWAHLNEDYSMLTRAQALALDGHFVVEQTVRQSRGWFFGFNGTAGLWRRTCIEDAGGWQADTLCEDLDLSYRAQLKGWQGMYLGDVAAPAEIPPQLAALKRQQARWATGSIQTFRKLAGSVAGSDRPLSHRIEGLIHLGAYFCHPLMLLLLLLTLPLLWFDGFANSPVRWMMAYLGIASIGPPLLYAVSQQVLHGREAGRQGWLWRLTALPLLVLMGTGLALNNTVAVFHGLRNRPTDFRRTPKFQLEQRSGQWRNKPYALPLTGMVLGELGLTLYALATVAVALLRGHDYAVPFLLLYVFGFGMMVVVGLAQGRAGGWSHTLRRRTRASGTRPQVGYREV
ncbi:MAG: glycosyltransferase family 2 protein [Anaerolineae bacterium]|nr:glycosyltransferase family 2 protein [Anaerolineae bacterium]MCB9132452.1 glycosyltransferase [Anaerolineales bacterium]MCB0229335.1 glycosyltransferase family 2 protein [Anaerolineae bacterium]MCB0233789.1 glycosyltransferase family 2 protein [Anaerolineae bacterium]MCB0239003.1 glycosyltransferase family 2 protein [Anaerolineae bacterium]